MNSSQCKFQVEDLSSLLQSTSGEIFIPRTSTGDLKVDINEPEREFLYMKEQLKAYLFLYPETKNIDFWKKLIHSTVIDFSIEHLNELPKNTKKIEIKKEKKKKRKKKEENTKKRKKGKNKKTRKLSLKIERKKKKKKKKIKKNNRTKRKQKLKVNEEINEKEINTTNTEEEEEKEKEKENENENNNENKNGKGNQNNISDVEYSMETDSWVISKKGIAFLKTIPVELYEEAKNNKINYAKITINVLTNKQTLGELNGKKEISKIRELKTFGFDRNTSIEKLLNSQISQTSLIEKNFEITLPLLTIFRFNTQYQPLGQTTYLSITAENQLEGTGIAITDLRFPLSATRLLEPKIPTTFTNNPNGGNDQDHRNINLQLKLDEKYIVTNLSGPQLKKKPITLNKEESATLLLKLEKKQNINKTNNNQGNRNDEHCNDGYGNGDNKDEKLQVKYITTAILSVKVPFVKENLRIDIPVKWAKVRESQLQIRSIPQKINNINKLSKLKIEIYNNSQNNYKLQLNVPLEQKSLIQLMNPDEDQNNNYNYNREQLGYVDTPVLCSEVAQIIKLKAQRSKSIFLHFIPLKEGLINLNFWFLELNSNTNFFPDEKCVIFVNDENMKKKRILKIKH
ncbi:poly(a) RNA polymerase [Anaeramoeba flamelloides]|uniref:Poly(A) RNA polymerase n=1 Tax=Anaeramoeba flamelloides TaxID=1746091 RepID=A0AAV7Z7Y7_9EUKA|nr:poly(a) RNA polymerase [Anaeramoeba flamelloides]